MLCIPHLLFIYIKLYNIHIYDNYVVLCVPHMVQEDDLCLAISWDYNKTLLDVPDINISYIARDFSLVWSVSNCLTVCIQVPTIAIVGSGGGFRAMVGFSGVMKALYESGVLDCATYVAGLSGSTWSVFMCLKGPGSHALTLSFPRTINKSIQIAPTWLASVVDNSTGFQAGE